jgi:hypothetical protein
MALSPEQQKRTLTIMFLNVSYVDFLLGITTKKDGSCGGGRNIMYSFKSALAPTLAPTPAPTPPPTPAPTASPTAKPSASPTALPTFQDFTCATCVIWGDPHIITFEAERRRSKEHPLREAFFRTRGWKADQLNVQETGEHWLVRSDMVYIQGEYSMDGPQNMTALVSITIGGPFMDGHSLVVRPLDSTTTWDHSAILGSMPSEFKNEFVYAKYHTQTRLVKDGTRGPGIDIILPVGVTMTVNRWKSSLAAEITVCSDRGINITGLLGQCVSH